MQEERPDLPEKLGTLPVAIPNGLSLYIEFRSFDPFCAAQFSIATTLSARYNA